MQFTEAQRRHLIKLEFSWTEIMALSQLDKEEVFKAISKQKKKLSLKYHPDRNNNDPELTKKFLAVTKAYNKLINADEIKPSILDGIAPFDYQIPLNCIDFRIEEQIDNYFENISFAYMSLSSNEDKKKFVKENESFLQFITWLNKHRSVIRQRRDEAFYQVSNAPSLFNILYQDWNKLVIQLFAEENLDDITYREAIALGNLWPILAVRKLLSPLKWLCLIVSGTYNLLTTIPSYFIRKLFKSILDDVSSLSSNWYRIFPFLGKVAVLMAILIIPLLLLPEAPLLVLLSLPLLTRGLFYLANPINHIIRPIAEYFNISVVTVGILTVGLGIAAVAGLSILLSLSSSITLLLVLADILAVSNLLASLVVLKKLYEVTPPLAIILGITQLVSLIIPVDTSAVVETLLSSFMLCLSQLSMLGINIMAYKGLSNVKEQSAEVYSTLPLPEQKAPEIVKQVVAQATQKNYWSHSLFNTSENAKVATVKKNEALHSMGIFGRRVKNEEHSEELLSLLPPSH